VSNIRTHTTFTVQWMQPRQLTRLLYVCTVCTHMHILYGVYARCTGSATDWCVQLVSQEGHVVLAEQWWLKPEALGLTPGGNTFRSFP